LGIVNRHFQAEKQDEKTGEKCPYVRIKAQKKQEGGGEKDAENGVQKIVK